MALNISLLNAGQLSTDAVSAYIVVSPLEVTL